MIGLLIRDVDGAAALVRGLTWAPLSAVYSSPSGHAFATAQPLANDHGLDVRVRPALKDGDGETFIQLQQRIVDELLTLAKTHEGETIALVICDEPIRCALAAFDAGVHGDLSSLELTPAHVSTIGITGGVRRVLSLNVPADEVSV